MADHYDAKPWLKFYDKHIPSNITYPEKSYWEIAREAFTRFPDRAALHYMGHTFTFRQMDNLSSRFATYLVKNGIKKGDIVGINLPNLPAYYIAMLGIQKAGCILSGVSPLLTTDELRNQLKDSGAKVLVTLDALISRWKPAVSGTGVKYVIATSIGDYLPPLKAKLGKMLKKFPTAELEPIEGVTVIPFMQVMRKTPADNVDVKVGPDDIFAIQYTGGTTGLPKGAEITQRNFVSQVTQFTTWVDMSMGGEVGQTAFPLFHIAGLMVSMSLFSKAVPQIAIPNPRDQKMIISTFKKYRPDIIGNVPTVYLELMKLPEFRALDFSKLKYFASAAAPFPPEYIKEFERIVGGAQLIEVYGLTETMIITAVPRNGQKKPGSAGVPFPDTEIKIVDPATGAVLPFDEPGELIVRGPQVFSRGYLKKPEETANAVREGWFHTGDIARMDSEGYVFIVDRLKDMVNVSGYKVFTRELDDVIMEHPDVFMGASVGVPDPDRPGNEMVATAIVLKPGIEKTDEERKRIIEYLRGKVAPYKVPRKLEFMDQLPTSAVGKVLKRELRTALNPRAK
ncbi:MAG: AMP-binding protein [Dehalococcoidia bacterium]